MGIAYNLTDDGRAFVESGKSIREKITNLESQDIKNRNEAQLQKEKDEADTELDLKSKIASITSRNEARWLGIIGILLAIVLFVIDKCDK